MTANSSSLAAIGQFSGAAGPTGLTSDADIRLLRVFAVVVASGGLSAATAELQADLSSVSRQIKELEARVGARLCSRGRGGFALTLAGARLHHASQSLFGALKAFDGEVLSLSPDAAAELRIGVVDALLTDPRGVLAQALTRCMQAAPGLRVALSTLRPIEIERQLLAGELEVGIVAAHTAAAGLERRTLYAETSSLYCAPGHALFDAPDGAIDGVATAGGLALVADPFTVDLPRRGWDKLFRVVARADSMEGVATMVCTGSCVGFLPDHYVAAIEPLAALRAIRRDVFSYAQDIELTFRQGARPPVVQALLNAFRRFEQRPPK